MPVTHYKPTCREWSRPFRDFVLDDLRQHRTIPALRLKHRSGGCGTASALPKCSIMSGCGTRIVLRGQKPLALCNRCLCFGSLFPPLAALTFAASSIICAFGLASAAPRSPYRHLKLCGIAYNKTKNPGTIFIPKSCRDLYYSMRSRLKFFAEAFFQKGWKGKLNINPCSFCWWPSCAGRGPGCACGCAGSPE